MRLTADTRGVIVIAATWALTNMVFSFENLTLANGTAVTGMSLFWSVVAGLAVGVIIGKITEYYTAKETKPAQYIAAQSQTGPATNIIHGLATGMESVALPVIMICAAIWISYDMGGVYGSYDGPCPPWNDSIVHHYHFTVYALDVETLGLSGEFGGDDVRQAIEGHVLAQAEHVGTYSMNPAVPA